MTNYRKIWTESNGQIPKDEFGFSYEIHHIDGNRANNDISNLSCISINEHMNIHMRQGDWGSAVLIAKRIGLGPDHIKNIQTGKKRPRIGGVKKGTIPWNKGKPHSIETKNKLSKIRQGNRYGKLKISDNECLNIKSRHKSNYYDIPLEPTKSKNGKLKTYLREFAIIESKKHNVAPRTIENILNDTRSIHSN